MLDPTEIPNIPAALDAETAKRIKDYPQHNNRASSAGHPCVRFLILSRVAGDKKTLHDVGLQRIFDEGNLHEDAVMREIQDAGLRLVEQQRPYAWDKFQLTGRIDGKIGVNGSYVPLEVKSCSPNVFQAIREMAPSDMLKSKYSWVRKYPAQILLYMIMEGVNCGIMLFKNKSTGEKVQKLFVLDDDMLAYAETVLQKLEAVNGHIAAGTLPDVVAISECENCPFSKTVCFPGQDFGPGFDIMTDAEIEAKLARRELLEPSAKEYAEIDAEVKEQFKGRTAIVGEWKIVSKSFETTSYNVPKEVKAQYVEKKQAFRTSIERI